MTCADCGRPLDGQGGGGMTAKRTRAEIKDSDLSDLQKRMALILLAVNGVDNAMRFVKLLQEQKENDLR